MNESYRDVTLSNVSETRHGQVESFRPAEETARVIARRHLYVCTQTKTSAYIVLYSLSCLLPL